MKFAVQEADETLKKVYANPLLFTSLACGLLFVFYFRARYAFTGHYVTFDPTSDDSTYFHYLIRFCDFLGITTGISEDPLNAARIFSGPHPPGIAIAWLPAALIAKLFYLFGIRSYSELLFTSLGVLNWFYFCLAMYMMLKYSRTFLNPGTLLMLFLTIPVLYYSTHRTTMTHPAEAVFTILFLHLMLNSKMQMKSVLLQAFILIFLTIIRYQYALLIPVFFFLLLKDVLEQQNLLRKRLTRFSFWAASVLICAFVLLLVYRFWPSDYIPTENLKAMYGFHRDRFRWMYTWIVPLVDPSWGILYLSGGACVLIFFSIMTAVRSRGSLNFKQTFFIVWIFGFYLIACFLGKQGDDIQYRVLVPLLVLAPFLVHVFSIDQILNSRTFKAINIVSCILTLLLVWLVKTREYLTVSIHPTNFWMQKGWNNFWLIPKMIYGVITNPVDLVRPLALTPPGALIITALDIERLQKYELNPIAVTALIVMMIAHLLLLVWAMRRAKGMSQEH